MKPLRLLLLPAAISAAAPACSIGTSYSRKELPAYLELHNSSAENPVRKLTLVTNDDERIEVKRIAVLDGEVYVETLDGENRTVPIEQVKKVLITRLSGVVSILGGFGVALLVLLGLGIVVASAGGSCPAVAVWDGVQYQEVAETFPGAIGPERESDDAVVLPGIVAEAGRYRLRVVDDHGEWPRLNALALMAADHDSALRAGVSPDGKWRGSRRTRAPVFARDTSGADLTSAFAVADERPWLARDDGTVEMEFASPAKAGSGTDVVLWLRARNLPAAEGTGSGDVGRAVAGVDAWIDGAWREAGHLSYVGPRAWRDVPIALPRTTRVRVRSTGGWAIDEAHLGVDATAELAPRALESRGATHRGRDVAAALAGVDGQRITLAPGEWIDAVFAAPALAPGPGPGKVRTFALFSRGWYEPLRSEARR